MTNELPDQSVVGKIARIRVLETTDLHMQLMDFDYFADSTVENNSLMRLVDQITNLRRAPGQTCMLFDNGDFLQGNPLADYLASDQASAAIHPMIAAFNTLHYDAIGLGNHEFNYGLPFLRKVLKDADFPVTCANITTKDGGPLAEKFVILDRILTCDDGQTRPIKIGVIGLVTPQITQWDYAILDGALTTEDIVDCAKTLVPQIKAAGADLIIALCHSGIGATKHTVGMENAAVPLAGIKGIDVILMGHTHSLFPGDHRAHKEGVDPIAGTLHGKPAVMAGFYGNRLGVIDLELQWNGAGWDIQSHAVSLVKGGSATPATQKLRDKLTADTHAAHAATLAHIQQPIATTNVPIHSYLATTGPDLSQQLLADAQRDHMNQALCGGAFADLPVICVTAPFRFGDKAGPAHYIDIATGPLTVRDAAAIYPFTNALCGSLRSGADLRAWLERAASHFMQVVPGGQNQSLIHPQSPGYNYDTLFGLHYDIDLSQPARYDPDGGVINPNANRIRNLRHQDRPVADTDRFILAANSYRANGGGSIQIIPPQDIIYTSKQTTRDILIAHLGARGTIDAPAQATWRFSHLPDTSAIFFAAPTARHHMTADMRHMGPARDGFDRYQLIL